MALDTQQMMLIEQRVSNDGPSTGVAWLLWFFLGLVGGHRFYLGRGGSGFLMIIATICGFIPGAIWLLVDAFLLSGMIRAKREEIRQRVTLQLMAGTA